MSYDDLEMQVIRWAEANGQFPKQIWQQSLSTTSAVDNMVGVIALSQDASDAIGVVVLEMVLLCVMLDVDLTKSLEQAFARISAKPEKSNVVFLKQE